MLNPNLSLTSLNQLPDLCVWKKDLKLRFVDLNETAAKVFGFYDCEHALGKTDYEIPSGLSKFANVFRQHDSSVLKKESSSTFLEIQPCANEEWKILHVVKNPYYEKGLIAGVIGYSVDITKTYMRLEQFFVDRTKSDTLSHRDLSSHQNELPQLSRRESECLFFLIRRCTAKEIANLLNLSYRTVEHYIELLKSKFACETKYDLIQLAKELGYINAIPPSLIKKQLSIVLD